MPTPSPTPRSSRDLADDAVLALEATVRRLESEVEGLRTALRTRGVIEQAKGILIAQEGLSPDEAFHRLRAVSQTRNTRLIDVAATLVGVAAPPPGAAVEEGTLVAVARAVAGTPDQDPAAPDARDVSRRARDQLRAAAAATAPHGDALAGELLAAAADLGPAAVVVYRAVDDGALELVGGAGFPEDQLSAWSRIPPEIDVPLTAALRTRRPVWLRDKRERTEEYVGSARVRSSYDATASVPVTLDAETLGVVGLAWAGAVDFGDEEVRRRLQWVGSLATPYLQDSAEPGGAGQRAWVRALLDLLPQPGIVLDPVFDDDARVIDFVVDLANEAARTAFARGPADQEGRRLLALWPAAARSGLLGVYAEVAVTGRPLSHASLPWSENVDGRETTTVVDVSATRVGRRVLVTWARSGPDARQDVPRRLEAIRHEAAWVWEIDRDALTWSAGLYRLLGQPAVDGPLSLSRAREVVVPDDLPVLDEALTRLFEAAAPASWLLRLRRPDGSVFRALGTAEPEVDSAGTVTRVVGTVLDLDSLERTVRQALRHGPGG